VFTIFYVLLLFGECYSCRGICKVVDERPFIAAVSLICGSFLYACSLFISMEIDADAMTPKSGCMAHRNKCVRFKEFVDLYGTDSTLHCDAVLLPT